MKPKYASLKSAIESFGARFALVNVAVSPIPVEATLDLVIAEMSKRLKEGKPVHPPRENIKGGTDFAGYEIFLTEPQTPGTNPPMILAVEIYTDLKDRLVITDQRFIAHGVITLALAEWAELVEAEQAKLDEAAAAAKAEADKSKLGVADNVTPFPGTPAPKPEA